MKSWGTPSACHMEMNSSVSFLVSAGPPSLNISAGIASRPAAFPQERALMAFFTSADVGRSSRELLISACGSLAMALSLIEDGRLRTLSECSAYLSLISSLSVISFDPSVVSRGDDPLL